jgi:hypothetical protein
MSYVPMGGGPQDQQPHYVTRPVGREPFTAWWMVFLPLPQLIQFPGGSLTLVPTLVIAAITGVVGVLLAIADQRILISNSHERRTPPWLALLPIVYLGLRGSRRFDETGKGMLPFWVHVAVVLVVGFLIYWGPDGVIAFLI